MAFLKSLFTLSQDMTPKKALIKIRTISIISILISLYGVVRQLPTDNLIIINFFVCIIFAVLTLITWITKSKPLAVILALLKVGYVAAVVTWIYYLVGHGLLHINPNGFAARSGIGNTILSAFVSILLAIALFKYHRAKNQTQTLSQ